MMKKVVSICIIFVMLWSISLPEQTQAATLKKTSITKLKNSADNSATVTFKKVSGAAGYQISYSSDSKFKSNIKTTTTTKTQKTIKGLSTGKTYYFKVRPYKWSSFDSKTYGKYSSIKKVKISKGIKTITLDKAVSGVLKYGDSQDKFKIKISVASTYGYKILVHSNYGKEYEWMLQESDGDILYDSYLSSSDTIVKNNLKKLSNGWYSYTQASSYKRTTGTYTYSISVPEYMFMDGTEDFKLWYTLELDTSIPYSYN